MLHNNKQQLIKKPGPDLGQSHTRFWGFSINSFEGANHPHTYDSGVTVQPMVSVLNKKGQKIP